MYKSAIQTHIEVVCKDICSILHEKYIIIEEEQIVYVVINNDVFDDFDAVCDNAA